MALKYHPNFIKQEKYRKGSSWLRFYGRWNYPYLLSVFTFSLALGSGAPVLYYYCWY